MVRKGAWQLVLAMSFGGALFVHPLAHAQTRIAVLPFEGSFGERARQAAIEGLSEFTILGDEDITRSAGEIEVDVSTPEGTARAIENLHARLVLMGEVRGRGRTARTILIVQDPQGNEMARAEGAAPQPRGTWAADLATAARNAVRTANAALPPERPTRTTAEATLDAPPPVVTEPEVHAEQSDRWIQPMFRGLGGIFVRNRAAVPSPVGQDRFLSEFYVEIDLQLETRPFSGARDWTRGLYAAMNAGASVANNYVANDGATKGMTSYNLGFALGYGIMPMEVLEITPTVGFGMDGMGVDRDNDDFPSTTYVFFRPGLMLRFRALEDLVVVEGGGGLRVVTDGGELGSTSRPNAFGDRGAGFFGYDLFLGVSGSIPMGFSWMARAAYTNTAMSYAAGRYSGGVDESVQFQLLLGWSIPGTDAAASSASTSEDFGSQGDPEPSAMSHDEETDLLNR